MWFPLIRNRVLHIFEAREPLSSVRREHKHSSLTAAALSCCRHSCDPWLGGCPGGGSGHASGSSPQVRALPSARGSHQQCKLASEMKPSFSCSLDVSSSAVQLDLVRCFVTVVLQVEQCKILVSYYMEKAITAYCLSLSKKLTLNNVFRVAKSNSQK